MMRGDLEPFDGEGIALFEQGSYLWSAIYPE
jgi:hypothetical protein